MDFFSFERAALRLKEALGVQTDKEVATLLGMEVSAFNKRKTRGSFPEKELRTLAQQRPELALDVGHVLTGEATQIAVTRMALNLGPRFREIRGDRTTEAFAALLGTTPEVISAIEGQTQLPTTELLRKLAAVHPDKDLIWLWGGELPPLDSPLTGIETILVMNYRTSSKEGQAALRRAAAFHSTYQDDE
jgi:transcriptional regulator with XRE-family HTH domain